MHWIIRYNPHRIETTVPVRASATWRADVTMERDFAVDAHLGSVTWHRCVDWNGYVTYFTTWTTAQ